MTTRKNKFRPTCEILENRQLLSVSGPSFAISDDAPITNFREVSVQLEDFPSDAESMRFAFNGFNYGEWQAFASAADVTLPSYRGTNWVNVEVLFATGQKAMYYDSIEYATPTLQMNEGRPLTNLRKVDVHFDKLAPDAREVRFAYNGFNYGVPVDITSTMSVRLPNYKGNNYVNAQILYANDQTRFVWDSIEYQVPTMVVANGAEVTHSRDVTLNFDQLAPDAEQIRVAFNGYDYSSPIAVAPGMSVTLPSWDGMNYTNIKVLYPNGQERFLWDSIDYMPDSDGDGLYDRWEIDGIDVDNDGSYDLQLSGADPNHPDLYIEIDAMLGRAPAVLSTPVPGLDPDLATQTVLDGVIEAFDRNGIHLHLLIDETDIPISDFPNEFEDFNDVKAQHWGTEAERSLPNAAATLDAKRRAYRYAMFANTHGSGSSSGLAEWPGNNFMVTLGAGNVPGGTGDQQAGTFMHELGHTLDLAHGGGDPRAYKPNYHSVMNYLWQIPGFHNQPEHWVLDYSSEKLPTLDERDLTEADGIGFSEDSEHVGHEVTLRGLEATLFGNVILPVSVPENGPVDFNQDGDSTDLHVRQDLNGDGLFTELHGHDDWSNLRLPLIGGADLANGVYPEVYSEDDWIGNLDSKIACADDLFSSETDHVEEEGERKSIWEDGMDANPITTRMSPAHPVRQFEGQGVLSMHVVSLMNTNAVVPRALDHLLARLGRKDQRSIDVLSPPTNALIHPSEALSVSPQLVARLASSPMVLMS